MLSMISREITGLDKAAPRNRLAFKIHATKEERGRGGR
jgi:hypothetical protein